MGVCTKNERFSADDPISPWQCLSLLGKPANKIIAFFIFEIRSVRSLLKVEVQLLYSYSKISLGSCFRL